MTTVTSATLAQVSDALAEQNAINLARGNPPVGQSQQDLVDTPPVLAYFLELREVAVEQKITPTDAVRRVLVKFPDATRVDIKHSAVAVGINKFTARNAFDKLSTK